MTTELPQVNDKARFSVSQAAEILGVCRATIYRAIELPAPFGLKATIKPRGRGYWIYGKDIKHYWRNN